MEGLGSLLAIDPGIDGVVVDLSFPLVYAIALLFLELIFRIVLVADPTAFLLGRFIDVGYLRQFTGGGVSIVGSTIDDEFVTSLPVGSVFLDELPGGIIDTRCLEALSLILEELSDDLLLEVFFLGGRSGLGVFSSHGETAT